MIALGDIIAFDRVQCDLSRPDLLPSLIQDTKPDIIVNAAAYTAVDQAEDEERLATIVNGTAVGVIAEEARKRGALMVHYSTDYVFDGAKDRPYIEDDAPHPINAYGRSKLAGETAIRSVASDYIILRTSWVYSAGGRNFVRTVLRLAKEQNELRVVADQIGAPTWARRIAEATACVVQAAIQDKAENRFRSELYHFTASGAVSWHGFAEAILKFSKVRGLLPAEGAPPLHAICSSEFPQHAERPKNSRLAGDRFREKFGIVMPSWRQDLPLCLKEIEL
jgi:dTDP-4-dehydrorhamnose reductase